MSSVIQPDPSSSVHPDPIPDGYISRLPVSTYPLVLALIVGTLVVHHFFINTTKKAKFPLLNPAEGFELIDTARRRHFAANSVELLKKGQIQHAQQPYNILSDTGELTVLPPSMAHSIRNDPGLHFMSFLTEEMAGDVPGFEAFKPSPAVLKLIINVITKYLTKYLNKVTKPLSDEASFAAQKRFGTSTEWKSFTVFPQVLDIVAHLSSRVFLGEEVCRNEEWLEITKAYTVVSVTAAHKIRKYPHWLRQIVHWFSADCQNVRELCAKAKAIITPTIEKRNKVRQEALQNGEPVPKFDDAIDWFDQEGQGVDFDMALLQLFLSHSALHTTTDLVVETIFMLSHRPELVQELREEIATVLRKEGWKKTALFNMKLLDSVLKEVQRVKPIGNVSMMRKATKDVKLPNGDIIPKGARTVTSTELRLDANEYPNPEVFDGHRFLRWRGTERDSAANLVSTGPASLGFGHGNHACPGRFFAANEVKVALCHLLMKYDWQPIAGEDEHFILSGFNQEANPTAKLMVRRRESPEIDMDSVE